MPKIAILSGIGAQFYELLTVDSTNNYAMARVRNGTARHGMAWFAHEQTGGRGQRGKTWVTEPRSNIILSVIVEAIPIKRLPPFSLSAATALASLSLFETYAKNAASIKWPNDLYWGDRKAGGILIDNVYRGPEWQWSVVGIGMNINQTEFPEGMRAVSLKQATGREFNPVELARELCGHLEGEWKALVEEGAANVFRRYEDRLFRRGERVRFRTGKTVMEAEVRGINAQGQLLAGDRALDLGEAEWLFD